MRAGPSRRTFLAAVAPVLLLRPDEPKEEPTGLPALRAEIERKIHDSGASDAAVAYRDLKDGAELFIEADLRFHAASTMKVPVMMEVFRQDHERTFSLDDRIVVQNAFRSIVDGSPYELRPADDSETTLYRKVGQPETIRELVRLMITESSNLATNLLIDRVTAAKVSAFMARLGAPEIQVLRGVEDGPAFAQGRNNTLNARGLSTILHRLARREVVSRRASEAMLAILRGQKFREGIPAGLPPHTPVAHKTGSITGLYHDAGIIEPPDSPPYVLVVLTRDLKNERNAHALVAEIARAVHRRALDTRHG